MATFMPRLSRSMAMEAAVNPLPKEETTPPVTKIYFGCIIVITTFSSVSPHFKEPPFKFQSVLLK
jgi:hypothetical protein